MRSRGANNTHVTPATRLVVWLADAEMGGGMGWSGAVGCEVSGRRLAMHRGGGTKAGRESALARRHKESGPVSGAY